MDADPQRARADALAFLHSHKVGTLGTVSAEGHSHSRVVYYVCDDSFTIYFATLDSTRKSTDVVVHPQASFTVATEDVPQTVQIEGTVSEVTEELKMTKDLAMLIDVLMSNSTFYWPILKHAQGAFKLFELKPTWVRWGDCAFTEKGENEILVEISLT